MTHPSGDPTHGCMSSSGDRQRASSRANGSDIGPTHFERGRYPRCGPSDGRTSSLTGLSCLQWTCLTSHINSYSHILTAAELWIAQTPLAGPKRFHPSDGRAEHYWRLTIESASQDGFQRATHLPARGGVRTQNYCFARCQMSSMAHWNFSQDVSRV